jgi:hypothetical protein
MTKVLWGCSDEGCRCSGAQQTYKWTWQGLESTGELGAKVDIGKRSDYPWPSVF